MSAIGSENAPETAPDDPSETPSDLPSAAAPLQPPPAPSTVTVGSADPEEIRAFAPDGETLRTALVPKAPTEDVLDLFARTPVAESTRRVYARHCRAFQEWCGAQGAAALPASVKTVRAYAIAEARRGLSITTIRGRLAAVRYVHRETEAGDPTADESVANTLGNLERLYGTPDTPKQAALAKDVAQMVRALPAPPDGPSGKDLPDPAAGVEAYATVLRGVRDRALILVGFAGALRRSELAGLQVEHVSFNPQGMELLIPRSKGDQEGKGRTVGVNRVETSDLCPVRALRRWLSAAGIDDGPVFRGVPRNALVGTNAISGQSVVNAIKRAAEAAGLDPNGYAGHSLRRGHLTEAAQNGADLPALQRQAGHADPRTTASYVEDANRMDTNTSRKLGL